MMTVGETMSPVKAITNRHPIFLKEAYKMDGIVDLIDDERYLSHGDRYIAFDKDGLTFSVCIKTLDGPIRVRKFNNLHGAVYCARSV